MNYLKKALRLLTINLSVLLSFVFFAHVIHEAFIYEAGDGFDGAMVGNNYFPSPYIEFKGRPNHGPYKASGYRSEFPRKKDDDTYRIIFLGGSSLVMGEKTIPDLVEESFQAVLNKKKVEVLNFGVVSSSVRQDLSRLVHEVLDLKPDLVVFYHGYNELMNPIIGDPRPGYPFNFGINAKNPLAIKRANEISILDLLVLRSTLLRQYFPNFVEGFVLQTDKLKRSVGKFSSEWRGKIVNDYWNTLEKIQKISTSHQFDIAIFFQPVALGEKDFFEESRRFYKEKRENFKLMANDLVADKRVSDFKFFDLRSFFKENQENPFRDLVHIKDEYRKSVAKALSEKLLKEVIND